MERTAEQWREYRAARKAAGRPTPRGGPTKRKLDHKEWLAIDTEGADYGTGHVLTHIVCRHSGGQCYTLTDNRGIAAGRAIGHILAAHVAHPQAIAVWYAGGYDATMILKRLLTPDKLDEMWQRTQLRHPDGKAITWLGRYGVTYQPGKRLWLYDSRKKASVVIWDVFGFWQLPFVKALAGWLPDHPSLALITEGKSRRGAFGPAESEYVGRYCEAECGALCDLMAELARRLEVAGVRVNRWDGAGAIAAALLKANGVHDHMAPTPPEVMDPVRRAFFGGRVELHQYGHHDAPVYHYDLNSAYPAACIDLPSMRSGEWLAWQGPGVPATAWRNLTSVRLRWSLAGGDADIYPFPFRYSGGHICYPAAGEGWYFWPEYAAYLRHAGRYRGRVEVLEGLTWLPADPVKPFAWVKDVYNLRASWVRDGNPGEVILKKGLAAIYGKLAQQIGGQAGQAPTWHQLEWAGWVTSTTRARVYSAMMTNARAVIQSATDGIYATEPLPLPIEGGKPLGGWSYQQHQAGLFVQSGVYWLWDADRLTAHTRGFRQEAVSDDERLAPDNVLAAWQANRGDVMARLTVPCKRRFVTFGLVAVKAFPFNQLGTWQPNPKDLALYPRTKRHALPGRSPTPWLGLERTRAEPNQYLGRMSAPHRLAWWPGEETYREQLASRRALAAEVS